MLELGSYFFLQVLGIMGALDPHAHKRNQQHLPGSHGEVNHAASDTSQHIVSMEEFPTELRPTFATSDDYYSTVSIRTWISVFLLSTR